MNTRTIKWMAAGIIGLVMVQVFSSIRPTKAQPVTPIDPTTEEYILDRTVQIRLFAPLAANEVGQTDHEIRSYVMAKGLGTMVNWQGERVIVTHNHWGDMLKDAEYVTIHDADGSLLLKLALNEFASLIRYSDPGTLILDVPTGLPVATAILSDDNTVASGAILNVGRQDPVNPDQVEVVQARMLLMKNYKGQSVFKLAIIDDGMIVPGDSGGGIWLNGVLVGNTWASFIDTFKLPYAPETSLAAPLPMVILQADETVPAVSIQQLASLAQ